MSDLPARAGFIIPTVQWASGNGSVVINVPNTSETSSCYVGYSAGNPGCALTTGSNQPTSQLIPDTGTGDGALTAFVNASGAHLLESGDGAGSRETEVQGPDRCGGCHCLHGALHPRSLAKLRKALR